MIQAKAQGTESLLSWSWSGETCLGDPGWLTHLWGFGVLHECLGWDHRSCLRTVEDGSALGLCDLAAAQVVVLGASCGESRLLGVVVNFNVSTCLCRGAQLFGQTRVYTML